MIHAENERSFEAALRGMAYPLTLESGSGPICSSPEDQHPLIRAALDYLLEMNSLAPALKVREWVSGEPLSSFQPGKLYILEFCGTSCEPSEGAMRDLIELQET